ncbi:hypothetical protein D1BOALGB6SA_3116 [Olavius sp. associated proteobacterium Delta 1]|nr:hypothetical protein D1BOALGB6SA_3116 [Olavius sp. associated proteobacterium Delta 1]
MQDKCQLEQDWSINPIMSYSLILWKKVNATHIRQYARSGKSIKKFYKNF